MFRGIAGFGSGGEVHAADRFRMRVNLPIVIAFFDGAAVAEAAMAALRGLPRGAHRNTAAELNPDDGQS